MISSNKILTCLLLSALLYSCVPSETISNLPSPSSDSAFQETATMPEQPTVTQELIETVSPSPTLAPVYTSLPTSVAKPTEQAIVSPTSIVTPVQQSGKAIIIDHTSVALFDQIPEEYLTAARELKYMFSDRSVGQNINEALNCFTASSWETSPAYCRNDYYDQNWNWKTFTSASGAPERILFDPDPVKYNRDNWIFVADSGSWSELTQNFIQNIAPSYVDTHDVLSYQFTYLNVTETDDIADPDSGFFADNPNKYDIYDLEAYMAQHPDKDFVFWSTSLARNIGTQVATDFNNQLRQYVIDRGLTLLDIADIEAHTDKGEPCYDNRDGVQYCSRPDKCENFPDDGMNVLAICQDYTTETEGGHLGSVSAGGIQIAKAMWVLMARISGWNP